MLCTRCYNEQLRYCHRRNCHWLELLPHLKLKWSHTLKRNVWNTCPLEKYLYVVCFYQSEAILFVPGFISTLLVSLCYICASKYLFNFLWKILIFNLPTRLQLAADQKPFDWQVTIDVFSLYPMLQLLP